MCFFVIVYHQVQVGRLKDQVQKLSDEKEDIQLRESKLNQENARYTMLIHTPSTYSMSSSPFLKKTVSGGSRGGALGARPPPPPPLFWVKKEEMTEGRKTGWESKIELGPLLSFKVWIRH